MNQQDRDERRALVIALWNEGRSLEGIALETGANEKAIQKMLERARRAGHYVAPIFRRTGGDNLVSTRAAVGVFARFNPEPHFGRKHLPGDERADNAA